jgi:hypothetical protein
MQRYWTSLALGLLLVGCSSEPSFDECWQSWLVISNNSLFEYGAEPIAHQHNSGAFDKITPYGRFLLATGPDYALLLGPDNSPRWAGNWALPVSCDGRPCGLLLISTVERYVDGAREARLFTFVFLALNDDLSSEASLQSNGYAALATKPTSAGTPPLVVMDIDEDGTDEIVFCEMEPGVFYLHDPQRIRWQLAVYQPRSFTRPFLAEDNEALSQAYVLEKVFSEDVTNRGPVLWSGPESHSLEVHYVREGRVATAVLDNADGQWRLSPSGQ